VIDAHQWGITDSLQDELADGLHPIILLSSDSATVRV
jgi:hypothetical protein